MIWLSELCTFGSHTTICACASSLSVCVNPNEIVRWNFPTFSSCRGDAHGSGSPWQGAHMPRETEHCPDDEPLRITLAKAILAASHTLDNVTFGRWRHHLHICQHVGSETPPVHGPSLVARCIQTCPPPLPRPSSSPPLLPLPQSSIESLPPPTERHFIASLSVAFSVENT